MKNKMKSKKKSKKLLACFLVIAMILLTVGCGSGSQTESTDGNGSAETTQAESTSGSAEATETQAEKESGSAEETKAENGSGSGEATETQTPARDSQESTTEESASGSAEETQAEKESGSVEETKAENGSDSAETTAQDGAASGSGSEEQGPRQPGENGMYMTQTERLGVCTDTNLKRYETFFSPFMEIAEPFAITPGLSEKLIPQGMDQQEGSGNIYISGYFKREEDNPFVEKGNPTAVVVLDVSGKFIAEYTMYEPDGSPFTSHMGGVAVSEDTLYVSADQGKDGSGKTTYWIAAIPLEGLTLEGHQDVTVEQLYQVPVQPSFMNYSNHTLWIGNFYLASKPSYAPPEDLGTVKAETDGETFGAYLLGYDLSESGAERMEPADGHPYAMPDADQFYGITNRIQGMTMTKDGAIVLSRSYGRTNNSELLSYDPSQAKSISVTLDGTEYECRMLEAGTCQTFSCTVMPASEGVTVKADGDGSQLLLLFESGAVVYDGDGTYDRDPGRFRTDYVWEVTVPANAK